MTGFAVGGYQYLRLPADPAFSSLKLKANRLINTSGVWHALWQAQGAARGVGTRGGRVGTRGG